VTRKLLTAAAALGGAALFAYAVRRVGVEAIRDSVRRVGWGMLAILALGGIRFVLRAEAWRLCTPPASRLPLWRALAAFLAGDAVGNLTPLGLIASEPTKVLLTRHHLATRASVASLAVDNLTYSASVVVLIAIGITVMLATVPLPFAWEEWGIAGLIALLVFSVAAVVALRRGGPGGTAPSVLRQRLTRLRAAVLEFSAGHPARLWRAFTMDALFHVVAVAEAFIALRWLLGDHSPTFAQALVFEALNRVLNVAFKVVPFRVGIDEAASGAFAPVLNVDPVTGVALAVIRKVRNLCWAAVGLTIIAAHRGRAVPATDRP
jgi:hypothetical protein